jgi:hypothetical protein
MAVIRYYPRISGEVVASSLMILCASVLMPGVTGEKPTSKPDHVNLPGQARISLTQATWAKGVPISIEITVTGRGAGWCCAIPTLRLRREGRIGQQRTRAVLGPLRVLARQATRNEPGLSDRPGPVRPSARPDRTPVTPLGAGDFVGVAIAGSLRGRSSWPVPAQPGRPGWAWRAGADSIERSRGGRRRRARQVNPSQPPRPA